MKRFSLPLLLLFVLLGLTGCPPDTEFPPTFITITDFQLQTNVEVAPTTNITEVWAFANEEFIGAFPLPARIPVLRTGDVTLRFEAGVKQNGISTTPEIYEFYTPVERNINLTPGETIDLGTLIINYRPNVRFAIFETFEEGFTRAFTEQVAGEARLLSSQESVRTGSFSGRLQLTEDDPLVEIATTEIFSGLTDERPYVWLELDFRSAVDVQWGVTGVQGIDVIRRFDPSFRPRDEWTKIYFNMSETVVLSMLNNYKFNFTALLPAGLTEGDLYLDNIKLLYF
ncbi:MAG: hypothetical protein AAF840_02575 [Bacteroidota bacterium]